MFLVLLQCEGCWYKPDPLVTWQIQLSGTVNTEYDVELYDIDLFDSSADVINSLHKSGKKVICYFSAGSYEDWRPDASLFLDSDYGNPLDGWAGEWWLDVRSFNVRSIMLKRMDLAVEKGCDGIDPDNVDGYTNNTGFSLTAADQLVYNRFLSCEAHWRNLSVGLKNDLNQVPDLVDSFDFMVNEQCHVYNECDLLKPFIAAGKPVLNIEYDPVYANNAADRAQLCDDALSRKFSTLVMPDFLDGTFRYSCN
jgi:hypothetical protein